MSETPNQDEFVRLLAVHTSQLLSFIRILVFGDPDEAEEVYQRACLVLWKKFADYDPEGNFGSWACRIAHFEVLKSRAAKRKVVLLSEVGLESLAEAAFPIAAAVQERRSSLSHCLEQLDQEDLALVRRRYFDCASVNDIAKEANRSSYAIYRALSRVHGLLSRCVRRSMEEDSVGVVVPVRTGIT
ncbi:MAG: sigma-70 family RNA polymerase sigma factor [Planctomycetota bacterium]